MSKLTAYRINQDHMPIRRCGKTREWMEHYDKFPYKCLPLTIANQHGWEICAGVDVTARWDGAAGVAAVQILNPSRANQYAVSHFGAGILTFNLPYLFRTEPGVDLVVTGPANFERQILVPREGIVETWWVPFTFTMNWMFVVPNVPFTFKAGDPVCRIFPIPHRYIETFEAPEILDLTADPELCRRYHQWNKSRQDFTAWQHATPGALGVEWQKHYYRGLDLTKADAKIDDHQSTVRVAGFTDRSKGPTMSNVLYQQLWECFPKQMTPEQALESLNAPERVAARGGQALTLLGLVTAWRDLWAFNGDTRFALYNPTTNYLGATVYTSFAEAAEAAKKLPGAFPIIFQATPGGN